MVPEKQEPGYEEAEIGRFRQLRGWTAKAAATIAICMSLYHIFYVSGALWRLGIYVDILPHRAIHLSFILALIFLLVPPSKGAAKDKLPWYDVLLGLIAVAQPIYLVFMFSAIEERIAWGYATTFQVVLTFIMVVLLFEATRRVLGSIIPSLALFFIFYALFCDHFPGFMYGTPSRVDDLARFIGMWTEGVYGRLLGVAADLVIMFIILGQFLQVSGASRFFTDVGFALVGHIRGGPAKVAVVASALMGTVSGSGSANVATTGVVTIPMMKQTGYKPDFAGGVEAAASNGGQIMPPVMGVAAFLMADFLGIPYRNIAIAAVLPAILYFVGVFVTVDLEAAKTSLRGLPREQLPSLKRALGEGWNFFVPLLVLVYLMVIVGVSPQMSVLWALLALIIGGLPRKQTRIGLKAILRGLETGATAMFMVSTVLAVAGVIVGCLSLTGLDTKLGWGLVALSGGNRLVLLLLTAIACLILGMGMPTSAAYLLLAILMAPALVKFGFIPLGVHMFIFYWGLAAANTPPVMQCPYIAAAISGANPFRTAWQAIRLGMVAYIVPFMFIYAPSILMVGGAGAIALTFMTSLIGVMALAAALEGYLLKTLNPWQRVLLTAGAICLIVPGWLTDVVGIGVVALLLAWQAGLMRMTRWRVRTHSGYK